MHMAIEGLDGAGKTETAKQVANKLSFEFIEKPLHIFTDNNGMDNYLEIIKKVNAISNSHFRAMFYGTGNYLVSQIAKDKNVITDRHLVSNYYWNAEVNHITYFDELVKSCGIPDITFVLYVSEAERKRRIILRNPEDKDLERKIFSNEPYEKIKEFLERYNMTYEFINTTKMNLNEVVEYIVTKIQNTYNL